MNNLEVFDGNDSTAAIYIVLYHVQNLRNIIESYNGIPVYDDVINVFNTKVITQNFDIRTLLDTLINNIPRDIGNESLGSLININMIVSDNGLVFNESLYLTDVINTPVLDNSLRIWLIRSPLLFVLSDQHPMNAVYRCNLFNDLTVDNYYNLLIKNQTLEESYNPIAVCKTVNGIVHLYLYHDDKIHLLRNGIWNVLGTKNMNIYVKGADFVLYERQTASQNNFIGNMIVPFRNMILNNTYRGNPVSDYIIPFRFKDYTTTIDVKMPTLEKLTTINLTPELVMRQNESIRQYQDIERFHKFLVNRWQNNFSSELSRMMSKCNNILSYLRNVSIINDYKNNAKWLIDGYLNNEYKVIHDMPIIPANTPFQQEREMKIDFIIRLINILTTIKMYHKNKFINIDPVVILMNRLHKNLLFILQNFDHYVSSDLNMLDNKINKLFTLLKSFSVYLRMGNELTVVNTANKIINLRNKLTKLLAYTASKIRLLFYTKSKPDYQYLVAQRIQLTDVSAFINPMYPTTETRFQQNEEICSLLNDQQLKIFHE